MKDIISLYHGCSLEAAKNITQQGVDTKVLKRRDAGDFGLGFYLTSSPIRASTFGAYLVECQIVSRNLAYIKNPYFLIGLNEVAPKTPIEKTFHRLVFADGVMRTVAGSMEENLTFARRVHEEFILAGFSGITTGHKGAETVIFNPEAIVSTRMVKSPAFAGL